VKVNRFFSTTSRPVLRPTLPRTQWASGTISPRVKRQGVKLVAHLSLVPRSRMVELYFHSLIRLHVLVLNYFMTVINLPNGSNHLTL
jgi:hypothetical protein